MTDESGIRNETREQVWSKLRDVAYPDSRFGWDFSSFIADYEGSKEGANRLLQWAENYDYADWFITPDNNLDALREQLIERGESFVMPTYGIRRGFVRLDPSEVPEGQASFASTLDGMNRFAERIRLESMEAKLNPFDCMVTGASFVTSDGLRMGKGHGYFDLEWAMMRQVGLANENTDVVAMVHDAQVLDDACGRDLAADHDTVVDEIITPSKGITIEDPPRKPEGILWSLLDRDEVEEMPPLKTLWERAGSPDLNEEG
jgi:5-formyltetrahydrofolate cyclo-ligase